MGKNKGCSIFNIDDFNSEEFCQGYNFDCEKDLASIGRCQLDPYTGLCQFIKYFTNTFCIDENFKLRNLNAPLNSQ